MRKKIKTQLIDLFNSFIDELNEDSRFYPIIVEGKKDLISLRKLGVEGKIYCISGKSIDKITEDLRLFKKVILLTDFDFEGYKIKYRILRVLQEFGVKVDLKYSKKIREIVKGKVDVIEGLKKFISSRLVS
ncbi:MAG: toprim domain-containing protein [Candidatus Odinarchaeia archaeon]